MKNTCIAGQIFVLTGALENWTRNEATRMINRAGGAVSSTVNGMVNYVIVGDKPGAKLVKARKIGVPTISESQFASMLRQ